MRHTVVAATLGESSDGVERRDLINARLHADASGGDRQAR
jgi:hypothetical protein